jgi:phosphatidylglycerol:prolipoprotein diacylglycerol transferase
MSNVYPIALAAGTLASLLWISLSIPPSRSTTPEFSFRGLDASLWAFLVGIISARLGFVLLHLNYFKLNPKESIWFWDGGLSWIGAVLGALVGIAIFALINKQRFWPLADTIAVAAPILGFACWFGCLFDSCAYGKIADAGLLTPPSTDMFGVEASRWPVQGTGAIINLFIFLILLNIRQRAPKDGILSMISLSLISAGNLFLYFFRGDSIRLVNGYRLDALATIALLIISIIVLIVMLKRPVFQQSRTKT